MSTAETPAGRSFHENTRSPGSGTNLSAAKPPQLAKQLTYWSVYL
jgi:hypothetical protein